MQGIQRLIAAIWLGSGVFLMLSASAAFRAAGNTSVAADVVGSMLTRWHYIALAAPLILFAIELRRVRRLLVLLLFAAVLLAAAQAFVDLKIRSIRHSSVVPVSSLSPEDPVRRTFGALHGASMLLLTLQVLSAAIVVASPSGKDRLAPATSPVPEKTEASPAQVVMDETALPPPDDSKES